jgi:hypothetical protein
MTDCALLEPLGSLKNNSSVSYRSPSFIALGRLSAGARYQGMTLRKPFFFLLLDSFLPSPSVGICDVSCAASAFVPSVLCGWSVLGVSVFCAASAVVAPLGAFVELDSALGVADGAAFAEVGTVPPLGSLAAAGGLFSLPLAPVGVVVPSPLPGASLPAAVPPVPGVTVSTTAVLPTPPPVPPSRD